MNSRVSCGLFGWRPHWLQGLATKQTYILLYSILGAVQWMGNAYLSTVLSTIEKQFGIKSQEAAWIFSGNEISQICFILVIPFLPKIKKRPLWTSLALLASAFGSFLCAVPYLTRDKESYEGGWYVGNQRNEDLCDNVTAKDTLAELDVKYVRDWGGIVLIFVGFFITGIGSSFFMSFGIPYIDDNVSRTNSPLAISFVFGAKTLGPAIGSILGGEVLKLYVVPGQGGKLTEGDPGWLGAWWIGFIVEAVLLAFFAPFLALFPERLPTEEITDAKRKEMSEEDIGNTPTEYIVNTFRCFNRLIRNKIFMFNSISTICLLFGFSGFSSFGPKYFEYHFRQNASRSGTLNGMSRSFGTSLGILLSGVLLSKFKFSARTIASWNLVVTGALIGGFCVGYNLTCPKLEIYKGVSNVSTCQVECGCLETTFQPTCSLDGKTLFLSPCHAGCKTRTQEKHTKDGQEKTVAVFYDCACVKEASIALNSTQSKPWWTDQDLHSPISSEAVDPISTAVDGFCPVDCSENFYILLCAFTVTGLLVTSSKVGTELITLRAVRPEDKSASMVLMISVMSLFVLLPSPVIVGTLLDNICTFWGTQGGQSTTCLLYDTDLMRTTIMTFTGVAISVSSFADFGVWWYCKDINIFDEEENVEEEMKSRPLEQKI